MRRLVGVVAVIAAISLVGAGCSKSSSTSGSAAAQPLKYDPNAQLEDNLNLVIWPLYAEKDVVKPFETAMGGKCIVKTKDANTSDEMVNLMKQPGVYDGVSASGDATLRLIASKLVSPVDVNTFKDYSNVMPSLQAPAHNTVERRPLRRPVRVGPEHPDVQQVGREAGPDQLGCRVRHAAERRGRIRTRARRRCTTARSTSRTPRCT